MIGLFMVVFDNEFCYPVSSRQYLCKTQIIWQVFCKPKSSIRTDAAFFIQDVFNLISGLFNGIGFLDTRALYSLQKASRRHNCTTSSSASLISWGDNASLVCFSPIFDILCRTLLTPACICINQIQFEKHVGLSLQPVA